MHVHCMLNNNNNNRYLDEKSKDTVTHDNYDITRYFSSEHMTPKTYICKKSH